MRRAGVWIGAILLSACGGVPAQDESGSGLPAVVATDTPPAAPSGRPVARPTALTIACAPPGEAVLRDACAMDQSSDARGTVLTIRLPDGGFRRLRVDDDGRMVTAADGSEPASVRPLADAIEVSIGGARFRLPARRPADASG